MEKATDKQLALLQKLGATFETNVSKEEASKLIEQIITTQQKYKKEVKYPQIEKIHVNTAKGWKDITPKPKFDTSSYYVAYAKDLCIAMLEAIVKKNIALQEYPVKWADVEVDKIMETAIHCIQMAKSEFE